MTAASQTPFETLLIERLERSVGGSCAQRCSLIDEHWEQLSDRERRPLNKAVAKRRREFAAGRVAARRCAQRLGVPITDLPMGEQREPCWPESLVGSITHDAISALAWVAPSNRVMAMGLDVERTSRLKRDTWRLVFTDREQKLLNEGADQDLALTLFSAKESVYKCLFSSVKRFVGYKEVCIDPISDSRLLCRTNAGLANESGVEELEILALRSQERIATWTWLVV